jgi:hypothetical protein
VPAAAVTDPALEALVYDRALVLRLPRLGLDRLRLGVSLLRIFGLGILGAPFSPLATYDATIRTPTGTCKHSDEMHVRFTDAFPVATVGDDFVEQFMAGSPTTRRSVLQTCASHARSATGTLTGVVAGP